MAELHFVKSSGALKPADPDTEAVLNSLTVGEVVSANLHRPSVARQYARSWYAMVTLGYEHQDRIAHFEKFVDACLVAGGYFEFAPRLDGSTVKVGTVTGGVSSWDTRPVDGTAPGGVSPTRRAST